MSLGAFCALSQELPPIDYYSPEQYGGENQNWGISQSDQKFIYVANNKGLLEFNGASWRLYPSPNQTIIRSVKYIDKRIYTGCYMEFGYWSKNESNELFYTSLSNKLHEPLTEDEQIWQIYQIDDYIAFCSLNRIYFYDIDSKSFQVYSPESLLLKTFKVSNTIFYQNSTGDLLKFEHGKADVILSKEKLQNNIIINMLERDGKTLLITEKSGILIYESGELSVLDQSLNSSLTPSTIYSAINMQGGMLALGTISNGIFIIDKDYNVKFHIKQEKGLGNNTILSLFEDAEYNLWLGLDNGINVINILSPFKIFNDYNGELGTVYTSLIVNGNLYLGTNQGLFVKNLKEQMDFKFVEGTKGQVWVLREFDGKILCGHNLGTFLVKDNIATLIINEPGTWEIKKIPNTDLLLQGNYSGLFVLEIKGEEWFIRNKIEDFNISSRIFEVLDYTVIVNHEYKGVYRIKLDEDFRNSTSISKLSIVDKGIHSSLNKYQDSVIYFSDKGIYKYNPAYERFRKDKQLTQLIGTKNYSTGKLVVDSDNDRIWAFSEKDLKYVSSSSISDKPIVESIPIDVRLRKDFVGFENLLNLENDKYLFGTSEGYLLFDLNDFRERENSIFLNDIAVYDKNNALVNINTSVKNEFNVHQNNLEFNYSIPVFDRFTRAEYRYTLDGYMRRWSNWSEKPSAQFKNLPFGEYKFKVEGRVGNDIIEEIPSYSFKIQKPWYLSNFMIFLYIMCVLAFYVLMHILYRNYYNQQKIQILKRNEKELAYQQMVNDKQKMKFENDRLQKDVESKTRELAISTMSLIKKNEFLTDLKKEISKMETTKDSKRISKIVDSKISNDDDWKFFEEAFNNADQDFLKNIKEKHPALNPNDLRLCAYLRLNLSSKEISPLLNITYRSVEIKRYRLRKKMGLSHKTSLTQYILEI